MADLAPVPASVVTSGVVEKEAGILGATLLAGDVVYKDTAAGNVLKAADCNDPSAVVRSPVGILLNGGASGQPAMYIKKGQLNLGVTLIVAKPYYLSFTAGKIMPVADLASGHFAVHLGIAKTAALLDVHFHDSLTATP